MSLRVLGTATVAKVYPAVVLPLALGYVWRRRGGRDALVCGGVALGVVAAWLGPFAAAAPDGVWSSLSGKARRPLQIENLGASAMLAAHQLWDYGISGISSHGSDNLTGRLPDALATVQALLVGVVLVAIWTAFLRGPAPRDRLLRYSAAANCAFVALGKVLSPQYLIWLIPLIPLVRGRRGLAAAGLFLAALVLTQLRGSYSRGTPSSSGCSRRSSGRALVPGSESPWWPRSGSSARPRSGPRSRPRARPLPASTWAS